MKDLIIKYIQNCLHELPAQVYWVLLAVLVLGAIVFWAVLGFRKGTVWSLRLLLLEYLYWLFSLTFLTRSAHAVRSRILTPFRSYQAIREGDRELLVQVIGNVGVFIPVGLLLGCAFGRMKWWTVALIGAGLSMVIELLQYVFQRGYAEFDDVFHNLLGCLIGYGVYALIDRLASSGKYTA